MWKVKRFYNGTVGIKSFNTKEEAEKWLSSDSVQQDIADGMYFELVKEENYDD